VGGAAGGIFPGAGAGQPFFRWGPSPRWTPESRQSWAPVALGDQSHLSALCARWGFGRLLLGMLLLGVTATAHYYHRNVRSQLVSRIL